MKPMKNETYIFYIQLFNIPNLLAGNARFFYTK